MRLTRLGPHVIEETAPALAWLRSANIVKVKDRAHLLRQCHPDAVTIYRRYFPVQDLSRHGADVAREVIRDCQEAQVRPTFIELYNEVGRHEGNRLLQLAAEAQPVAREYGTEVLALSGGTGWWEEEDWERWADRDFYGLRHFALHCYWGAQGFTPWNACRWEQILDWLCFDPRLTFWIVEAGRDAVEGGKGGWRADGLTPDQYRAEVQQYNDLAEDCPQVGGVTLYTAGAGEGTWAPFDTDPLGAMQTEPRRLWSVTPIGMTSGMTSGGSGGGSNVGLAVAIIPSNQQRNVSSVPGYSQYNEYGGMMSFAHLLKAECQAAGLKAEVFDPGSEVNDKSGVFAFVSAAVKRANEWLKAQGGGVEVNLHTDSGVEFSHTFGIHTVKFAESQRLAVMLGQIAHRVLATEDFAWFDRLGNTNYNSYIFAQVATYPTCLIELCSHQSTRDMAALWEKAGLLAKEMAAGLAAWAGISPAVPVSPSGESAELDELRDEVARLKARLNQIGDLARAG